LSILKEQHYAQRALLVGAKGFITKQEVSDVLFKAIKTVLKDEIWLSDEERQRHINAYFASGRKTSQKNKYTMVNNLSDRELRNFSLIGKGFGSIEIADELCISTKTVEAHKSHIKDKLLCGNSRQLLQLAIEWTNRITNSLTEK
jgi:DNA-binding NarL/FixJ family response regulator